LVNRGYDAVLDISGNLQQLCSEGDLVAEKRQPVGQRDGDAWLRLVD
jgi:hypothetical protein